MLLGPPPTKLDPTAAWKGQDHHVAPVFDAQLHVTAACEADGVHRLEHDA